MLALGRAVLWAAFEETHHPNSDCPFIPSWLRRKVTEAFYEQYGGDGEEDPVLNPISKVTIIPQGSGDQVHLMEVGVEPEEREGGGRERNLTNQAEDMTVLLSHQLQVQRQIEESRAEVLNQLFEVRHHHSKQLEILNRNIKRIALQPVIRPRVLLPSSRVPQGTTGEAEDGAEETAEQAIDRMPAKLYKSPKSLHDLWHEFQFGLNGSKPAREFTLQERGKNKSLYCRRKVFWDTISSLVRAGFTSEVAIDKVYQVYGRGTSVTTILIMMIRDRKTGGNPNLRV